MKRKCFNCYATTCLHSFPKSSILLERWKKVIPNFHSLKLESDSLRICSAHFDKKFVGARQRSHLFENAVPSKFMRDNGTW